MKQKIIFIIYLLIFLTFVTQVNAATQAPFGGVPWKIPGLIQFEDYDTGGEGVSFHDADSTNASGQYRTSEAVDIQITNDGSGSPYDVNRTAPGEWLEYTVNVLYTGTYTMMFRTQEWGDAWAGKAHMEVDGVNVTGTISFNAGVWNGWNTYYIPNLSLIAGQHILRWYMESASMPSAGNFNWMYFEQTSGTNNPIPVIVPSPGTQIFYVSPNGNDLSSGTISAPWKTIAKAANTVTAGQTVYVRAGIYAERLIPANSGTENAYIIFSNYPGETVTLDGNGISIPQLDGIVTLDNKSYIRITGFKIINAGANVANGFWNHGIATQNSDHIVIDNNYISHIYSSGMSISTFTNYSLIDSNELVDTNFGSTYSTNTDTEVSLGIYWFSNHIEIKNNKIHDVYNEGYDPVAGVSNISVHDNIAYNVGRQGFYVDSWTEIQHDIEFYNNISYNNGIINGQGGFLVSSEAGGTLENVKFYNNIAYGNRGEGFYITSIGLDTTGKINNVSFINNTIYNNQRAGILVENPKVTNILLRNNIVYQNQGAIVLASGVPAGVVAQDHNLITNPLFVNAASANFHLQSLSPAKDAGSSVSAPSVDFDGAVRPAGIAFDIGAYEYGGVIPSPQASPLPSSTPIPSPSPSIADLKTLITNWLTSLDSSYLNKDGKVNALDAAWVIKWLVH